MLNPIILFKSTVQYKIRMKALKVNEKRSLRILDQAIIYLLFSDIPISVKLNVGMNWVNAVIGNKITDITDNVS